MTERSIYIPISEEVRLEGELIVPEDSSGIAVFAHGSGSGRHSPRNQYVAGLLRDAGLATLLFDLLTADEESVDVYTRHLRFDIGLLAGRLATATRWLYRQDVAASLRVGYFGASTGAGAALAAAAELGNAVAAVVSRGGRPDLAGDALSRVTAPTLLIVGESDTPVIEMNKDALGQLRSSSEMQIVPGASHLFEESGCLDRVAQLAAEWFTTHFRPPGGAPRGDVKGGFRNGNGKTDSGSKAKHKKGPGSVAENVPHRTFTEPASGKDEKKAGHDRRR